MEISIFGLGYVGAVSAACLSNSGYFVIGVDSNPEKVAMINNGQSPIVEPGLKELISSSVSKGHLRATDDPYEAIANTELSFICVGTPSKKNNSLDLQYIERICKDIGFCLKEKEAHHILVFRSTLFPGVINEVVLPLLEQYSDKKEGVDFSIGVNPEFMREGSAIYDYYHPPKNIVGTEHQRVRDKLSEINFLCTKMSTIFINIDEAGLLKYVDNIWHALKVGFANEIGNMCKSLSIDSHLIIDLFCKDTKLNISPHYLKPGSQYDNQCVP